MSHPLLMALFHDVSAAAKAARDVHALGIDRANLSVVAADHQVEGAIASQIDGSPGSEIEDSAAASRLGALGGYVLAAIAIGLPGTGALVAAGSLAAELGEAAGHVAGDVTAILVKAGLSEQEAVRWHRRIENGSAILLGVHARTANRHDVEAALSKYSTAPVVHTQWSDEHD